MNLECSIFLKYNLFCRAKKAHEIKKYLSLAFLPLQTVILQFRLFFHYYSYVLYGCVYVPENSFQVAVLAVHIRISAHYTVSNATRTIQSLDHFIYQNTDDMNTQHTEWKRKEI